MDAKHTVRWLLILWYMFSHKDATKFRMLIFLLLRLVTVLIHLLNLMQLYYTDYCPKTEMQMFFFLLKFGITLA